MARPVWFHFSSEWMIAIPAALLLVLVASDILTRMVLFGISTFLGEVIFTLYIHQLGFNEPVGEPAFLDMYSIVVFLLLSTELFMHFVDTIEKELNRRMKRKVGMKQ
nr:hypothetical protein [Pontibacillus litoralis]